MDYWVSKWEGKGSLNKSLSQAWNLRDAMRNCRLLVSWLQDNLGRRQTTEKSAEFEFSYWDFLGLEKLNPAVTFGSTASFKLRKKEEHLLSLK